MGCDIHMVLERHVTLRTNERRWVGVHNFPALNSIAVRMPEGTTYLWWNVQDRSYEFFAQLAGVRGDGPRVPKGVPPDVSDLARMEIDSWSGDGHNHSYLPLREFAQAYLDVNLEANAKVVTQRMDGGSWALDSFAAALVGADYGKPEDLDDFRVVFWFDN